MEAMKRELSLVSKYIRERIKEMEIDMEVRRIKEPHHLQNESFEKNMRRKLKHPAKRKRIRLNTSFTDPESNDAESEELFKSRSFDESDLSISSEKKNKEEKKEEEKEPETKCPASTQKKTKTQTQEIVGKEKKMKCGCLSHGASKQVKQTFVSSTSSLRRKSMN